MKKILSIILVLTATMMVQAKVVTFNFKSADFLTSVGVTLPESGKGTTVTTMTYDGVTLTFTKVASTDNRIWNSSGSYDLRMYNTSYVTITAEENITAIMAAGSALAFAELSNGSWSGEPATSVQLTANATAKVTSFQITIGEAPVIWTPDTVSVSEALALIKAGDTKTHFVKGIVAGSPWQANNAWPGLVTFNMIESVNGIDTLQAYNMGNGSVANKFNSLKEVTDIFNMGDTVLVFANSLEVYAAKNINEINGGYFDSVLGKAPFVNLNDILTSAYAVNNGATDGNFAWSLIFKDNEVDALTVAFTNTKASGIAGSYTQLTGTYQEAPISGSLKMEYVSTNPSTGYNEYALELLFSADGQQYRLITNMFISAFTAEYDELVLSDDIPFVPNEGDTITCAQAYDYAAHVLASGATSTINVVVVGYATELVPAQSSATDQTFWMADEKGTAKVFEAFHCTLPVDMSVEVDTKVAVAGKITNYSSGNKVTAEIKNGTITILEGGKETPREIVYEEIPDSAITVAEARQIGATLQAGDTTAEVTVKGYVAKLYKSYSTTNKNQSFYMYDNLTDEVNFFDFEAFQSFCNVPVIVGDYVFVTGRITVYTSEKGTTYNLVQGTTHFAYAPTGIQEVLKNADTESVQKVMIDGRLYILRDGVAYDMQGAVVR